MSSMTFQALQVYARAIAGATGPSTMRTARWVTAAALGGALSAGAGTGMEAGAVRAMAERLGADRRVALEYIRTGNMDLALVELERLRARWRAERPRSGRAVDPNLEQALARVGEGIEASLAAAEKGATEEARAALEQSTAALDGWRTAHRVRLFSDCIVEVSAAFATLGAPAEQPRLDDTAAGRIERGAAATLEALSRCDVEAPDDVKRHPEFRRLVDGLTASLKLLPATVARRDRESVHRLIIEQRSFERLLAFRFG